MDYRATLNLPRTDFPMRANLPVREPEIQRFWTERDIYRQVRRRRSGRPLFILHDGPPYANGDIHIGTALNKVLKDIVVKFATMDGYDSPYVPGWDTHGLPIELQAIKSLGIDPHRVSPLELRRHCREYALRYKEVQKEQFKRLGVRGDWDNSYLTLEPAFEGKQIEVFGEMFRRGYIYRGLKPVYWCADCQTALAEAEVEYHDRTSPSIYVSFPVADGRGLLPAGDAAILIWTTTPWTLLANTAIALHPAADYVLLDTSAGKVVVARALAAELAGLLGWDRWQEVASYRGGELEGVVCRHPFLARDSLVVTGEHVTLEEGTGCVHTAPGHGMEDYEVGQRYGLPVLVPVDDRGYFTAEAGKFAGLFYAEGNERILAELRDVGRLLRSDAVTHQYPHCWRCKEPVLFRATEQWFASVEGFRDKALKAIRKVRWIPPWGEERIANMVSERGDWCISRQRAWGVPIPVFFCEDCGEYLLTEETISRVAGIFARHGSDAWYAQDVTDLLPPETVCPRCGQGRFRKGTDIMDVWFDSGSSHVAVLETRGDLAWPADLYLEGSDQHRGWFQSSLLTAVAVRGAPPYRAVLTHGFVVDGEGRKMSKSLGNVISPFEIIEQYGADILRLWVTSADYRADIRVSPDILRQLAEVYRKIRNTFRFMLANTYDYDPERDAVPYEEMPELDRWVLHRLQTLVERVTRAYRAYEYHLIYHSINTFCAVDLSAFYLDVCKDRLYTEGAKSRLRRSAQTALHILTSTLVKLIAPVLSFTAEEVWQHRRREEGEPESVQLCDWPAVVEAYRDDELGRRWELILDLRAAVSKALELARVTVRDSLEARVEIFPATEARTPFQPDPEVLREAFIVSEVVWHEPGTPVPDDAYHADEVRGVAVAVRRANGAKCARCWRYSAMVGRSGQHPDICDRCERVLAECFPG